MTTDDDAFNAAVEAELNAQLEAELVKRRAEIAARLRRKAEREWYDRINARHPTEDKYGGLGPEGHAARLMEMDARARRCAAEMDAVNARPVEGDLRAQRAAHKGGRSGFTIK
jgi:hypothetical protein